MAITSVRHMRGWQWAALFLLLAFWGARWGHASLSRSVRELHRNTTRPFVLNGLVLRLDRFVRPAVRPDRSDARYLVVVTSDTCPQSLTLSNALPELIDSLRFAPADRVLIVSVNGVGIPRRLSSMLQSRGVAPTNISVTNKDGFSEETGITWTPALLALDARFRVRLVSDLSGPAITAALAEFFTSKVSRASEIAAPGTSTTRSSHGMTPSPVSVPCAAPAVSRGSATQSAVDVPCGF